METRGDMQCESIGLTTNAGQFASPCKNLINRKFTPEVVPHRPVLKVQYNSHQRSSPVSKDTRVGTIVRGYSRSSSWVERSARAHEYRFTTPSMQTVASRMRAIRQPEGRHVRELSRETRTDQTVGPSVFRSAYQFFVGRHIGFSAVISVFRDQSGMASRVASRRTDHRSRRDRAGGARAWRSRDSGVRQSPRSVEIAIPVVLTLVADSEANSFCETVRSRSRASRTCRARARSCRRRAP